MIPILTGLGWWLIATGAAAFTAWLTLTSITFVRASRIPETPASKILLVSALYTLPILAGAAILAAT